MGLRTSLLTNKKFGYQNKGFSKLIIPEITTLLDLFPGAVGAFALRKLRMGYTGDAINVVRTSDSAEIAIGFLSDGSLDLPALTSFVGESDGDVPGIYDQSTLGLHLFNQTNPSKFPKIIIGGVLQTKGGLPAINFDGANDFLYHHVLQVGTDPQIPSPANQIFSFHVTAKTILGNTGFDWTANYPITINDFRTSCISMDSGGNIIWYPGDNIDNRLDVIVTEDLLQHIYTFGRIAGTNGITIKQDGVLLVSKTPTTSDIGVRSVGIGDIGDGILLPAARLWQELILYTSDEQSNIVAIENNIKEYYSL